MKIANYDHLLNQNNGDRENKNKPESLRLKQVKEFLPDKNTTSDEDVKVTKDEYLLLYNKGVDDLYRIIMSVNELAISLKESLILSSLFLNEDVEKMLNFISSSVVNTKDIMVDPETEEEMDARNIIFKVLYDNYINKENE